MAQRGFRLIVTNLVPTLIHSCCHIYAAPAEKERRMISERTRVALAAKKGAGGRC